MPSPGLRSGQRHLLPHWALPYRDGKAVGHAQALAAYASYYCVDGIADDLDDLDDITIEHMPMGRRELQPYAAAYSHESGHLVAH